MIISGSSIKSNAKGCLKGYYAQGILAFFIFFALYLLRSVIEEVTRLLAGLPMTWSLPGSPAQFFSLLPESLKFVNWKSIGVSALFAIIGVFLLYPLTLGAKKYFWHQSGDSPAGLSRMFDFFASGHAYGKAVGLKIQIFFRLFLYGAALYFPSAVLLLLNSQVSADLIGFRTSEEQATIFAAVAGLLFCAGTIILIIISLRYFLAPYFISDDEALSVSEAIQYSCAWMQGNKLRLLSFILSFFGWFLLCLTVLPILYVYPYFCQSTACFARQVILEHGKAKEFFTPSEPVEA